MIPSFSKRPMLALVALFFLSGLLIFSVTAQDATAEPPVTAEATSEPVHVTFGSGPFNLMSPIVGLSSLSSYRAILTISFDGTHAGQSEQWSRTYTMLVRQTPPAWQLTVDLDAAHQDYRAAVNNTYYEKLNGTGCGASPLPSDDVFTAWEPAGFLDSVIGANEAGTDTVNAVAANHYTFDESALGASGVADSTGELWVASDGGYLARYKLVTKGGAGYFAAGIEGTLTWDYELEDVNQRVDIGVPADCPPGMLTAVPVPPDATNVARLPGYISYTTASSPADTVAFYQQQLSALGRQFASPPAISDNMALFGFMDGNQAIMVSASNDGSTTSVQIHSVADPADLAVAADVPNTAATTEPTVATEPASSNCALGPDSIPLLADATNVQKMPGVIQYTTRTSVPDAAAFYQKQLSALGGQVSAPIAPSKLMAGLQFTNGTQTITLSIIAAGGVNNVIIAYTNMGTAAPCPAAKSGAPPPASTAEASAAGCSVSAATNTNERSGPGTTYAHAGTLAGGTSAAVDGQATGADGLVWWRLGQGVWVRSDVVAETGNCDAVPVVRP